MSACGKHRALILQWRCLRGSKSKPACRSRMLPGRSAAGATYIPKHFPCSWLASLLSANVIVEFPMLSQRQLCVGALSQDTVRAANEPKCTAMGLGRDNACHCCQRMNYANASREQESNICDMCTRTSPPLPASVPVVRLLSEVVRHDVGANRGRTFQTTLLAWRNI